jgi:hypothetical protein
VRNAWPGGRVLEAATHYREIIRDRSTRAGGEMVLSHTEHAEFTEKGNRRFFEFLPGIVEGTLAGD